MAQRAALHLLADTGAKNTVPGGKLLHAQTQPSANRPALSCRLAAACRAYLRVCASSSRYEEQPSPAVIRWIYTAASHITERKCEGLLDRSRLWFRPGAPD